MDDVVPVSVMVDVDIKKKEATITDKFVMSDSTVLGFDKMTDSNVILCLSLASDVRKALEGKGYKVHY